MKKISENELKALPSLLNKAHNYLTITQTDKIAAEEAAMYLVGNIVIDEIVWAKTPFMICKEVVELNYEPGILLQSNVKSLANVFKNFEYDHARLIHTLIKGKLDKNINILRAQESVLTKPPILFHVIQDIVPICLYDFSKNIGKVELSVVENVTLLLYKSLLKSCWSIYIVDKKMILIEKPIGFTIIKNDIVKTIFG